MTDVISSGAPAAAHGLSPVDLFLQADTVVKTVMILLVLASAWGWAVILDKLIRLSMLNSRATKLIKSIQAELPVASVAPDFAKASSNDPLVQVYQAAVDEYARSADLIYTEAQREALQERVHRAAQLASSSALGHLQSRLGGLYGKKVASFIGVFEIELSRQLSKKGERNGLRVA